MAAVVFMGVAGCGKSSVAHAVAQPAGWALVEGDEFHPPANIAKMRAGIALDDADRSGWLDALAAAVAAHAAGGRAVALTCSALRRAYRDRLRAALPGLRFVFLEITPEESLRRVTARAGAHLFPPSLVASQFATLEPPHGEPGVLCLDATRPREALAAAVGDWLREAPIPGDAR
ncbi:gluconokinase [Piscinibacter sakaiensis]|uniref:Gluconokinase n=1 Tax=Piscinibacter sakaiensis TaxID=1547922 RepID=A0A0K8P459_PISS1|nr:gluconokinase [Piscinibacter sakaiensis]